MARNNQIKYGKKVSLIYLLNPDIDRLLFYLRDDKDIPERNKWSIFGGVIENGEVKGEGLERELREELNISVNEIRYLGQMLNSKNQKLYFFKGRVYENDIKNIKISEGQKVAYFNPDDIIGVDKFETSVEKFYRKNRNKILK